MKPVRLLAVSASPRKKGNSQFLLDTVLEYTKTLKFEVDIKRISLSDRKVEPCIGCLACYKNGGRCVLKDGFEDVRQLWKWADCILYCTPVYVAGIPGQLKCLFDRLSNADYGLEIRGARHMKTIGAISQGGDFFGGGAELCMVDIMRHAAMMNCVYIPPDTSYIGSSLQCHEGKGRSHDRGLPPDPGNSTQHHTTFCRDGGHYPFRLR